MVLETWILQILLSEFLHIPTSIEMGNTSLQSNFYHPDSPMDFTVAYDNLHEAFETASKLQGDCSKASQKDEDYKICGHLYPEYWRGTDEREIDMIDRGVLEPLHELGMLGRQGWFVPKFTAMRDPSLLYYLGLQGEDNRAKLAERFLRPTSWKEYCDVYSTNQCATPDSVAERAPVTDEENERMFLESLYTGYFRPTEKNNCTKFPNFCTGFFTDYPCSWTSPARGQIHHLGIALNNDYSVNGGTYSYTQINEIWRAANATKSDVILYWYMPDGLVGSFLGTDAEFTAVGLPPPTTACLEDMRSFDKHCVDQDVFEKNIEGTSSACGEPATFLETVMSTTIFELAYGIQGGASTLTASLSSSLSSPIIPRAIQSPSYLALSDFRISELQLDDLFSYWNELRDPRESVCQWVVKNMEHVKSFVPQTYPRTLERTRENDPLMYASTILGGIVTGMVLYTLWMVHRNRSGHAIQNAQVEFLMILLLGSFLIAVGAVIAGAPASNASCISEVFLVNIGYTLEIFPLIAKIAALNHIIKVGRRMKRTKIKRKFLLWGILLVTCLVTVYLIIWVVFDPPLVRPEYLLKDQVNEDGETVVRASNVCSSMSPIWWYVAVGWNALLLFGTAILAVQMHKVQKVSKEMGLSQTKGLVESPNLALLVYSHVLFVILRIITYLLSSTGVSEYSLARCRSLIYSVDTAATIIIYFLPKIFAPEPKSRPSVMVTLDSISMHAGSHHVHQMHGSGHTDQMRRNNQNQNHDPALALKSLSPIGEEQSTVTNENVTQSPEAEREPYAEMKTDAKRKGRFASFTKQFSMDNILEPVNDSGGIDVEEQSKSLNLIEPECSEKQPEPFTENIPESPTEKKNPKNGRRFSFPHHFSVASLFEVVSDSFDEEDDCGSFEGCESDQRNTTIPTEGNGDTDILPLLQEKVQKLQAENEKYRKENESQREELSMLKSQLAYKSA